MMQKIGKHEMEAPKGRFFVYEAPDGQLKLDVRLEEETVWLTGRELLSDAGTVSHEKAMQKAELEFEKYRQQRLAEPTLVERHFVEMEEELKKIESDAG